MLLGGHRPWGIASTARPPPLARLGPADRGLDGVAGRAAVRGGRVAGPRGAGGDACLPALRRLSAGLPGTRGALASPWALETGWCQGRGPALPWSRRCAETFPPRVLPSLRSYLCAAAGCWELGLPENRIALHWQGTALGTR